MSKKFDSIDQMPKARAVATRIVLGVWIGLGFVMFVLVVALVA